MAKNGVVKYETEHGEVQLSPQIIKKYLVSGDASKVTDQEVMMFLALCKYQRLNPFLREAYLIKYGKEPATLVVGKDTFTKRAANSELCKGWEAGVIVKNKDGKLEERDGSLVLPGEELVGGWAKVYRKDWEVPLKISVSLAEYQRFNKEGELQRNWKTMPATMIRKIAIVQALREAMPTEFQGMYSPEEMPVDADTLDETPVEVPQNGNGETKSEKQEFFCSRCGVQISQKVYDYSTKNLGAALCMDCQKQQKNSGQSDQKGNGNGINWSAFWAMTKEWGYGRDEIYAHAQSYFGVDEINSLKDVIKTQDDLAAFQQHLEGIKEIA